MVVREGVDGKGDPDNPEFGDISITSGSGSTADGGYSIAVNLEALADKATTAAVTGIASAIATKAVLESGE